MNGLTRSARSFLRGLLVVVAALVGAVCSRGQAMPDWIWQLGAHEGEVREILYAPNGQTVFTGSLDGQIRQWDVQSGNLVRRFWVEVGWLHEIALSDDGTLIAGVGDNRILKVFDVATGTNICSLNLASYYGRGLHFLPGSTNLLLVASNQLLHEVDPFLALITRSDTIPSNIVDTDISASGNVIAFLKSGGVCDLYDLGTRAFVRSLPNPPSSSGSRVDISPDGDLVAVGYSGSQARVFDTHSGTVVAPLVASEIGHVCPRFTTLGDTLILHRRFGPYIDVFRVVDWVRTSELLTDDIGAIAPSPDGAGLAIAHRSSIRKYEWPAMVQVVEFGGVLGRVTRWVSRRDDSQYASAHDANDSNLPNFALANLWEPNAGQWLNGVNHTNEYSGKVAYALDYSSDGSRIAVARSSINIFDASTGSHVLTVPSIGGLALDLRYSPDGSRIATVSADNLVKVWNAETGSLITTLTGHTAGVSRCFFRGNNELITASNNRGASGGGREVIHWNISTGQPVRSWTFTENLKTIYVASTDRLYVHVGFGMMCQEISVASGNVVKSFALPASLMAVSRDGTTLQSSSWLTSGWYTHFVDTSTGAIVATLNDASGMEFTNDGSRVFTQDGVIDNPVQHEFSATAISVTPPAFVASGSLNSIIAPRDDQWLRVRTVAASVKAPPIMAELSTDSDVPNPRALRVRMLSKSNSGGSWTLSMQFFDFVSGSWSTEARVQAPLGLTPIELVLSTTQNVGRFIGSNGQVRMRLIVDGLVLPRGARADLSVDYVRFEMVN